MRTKTSICFFSLSLFLLAGRTFAGNEFASSSSNGPAASEADTPLSYEFDAEETYIGGSDVERGSRSVRDFTENDASVRFVFTPRVRIALLCLGAGFRWRGPWNGVASAPYSGTPGGVHARVVVGIRTA